MADRAPADHRRRAARAGVGDQQLRGARRGRRRHAAGRARAPRRAARAAGRLRLPGRGRPVQPDPEPRGRPARPGAAGQRGRAAVRPSVLKINARATACERALEGSGFVIAPHRVMTNAHVVAGAEEVSVESGDKTLPAEVVLYDPRVDIAILRVPSLAADPLDFAGYEVESGQGGIVLGYPLDGPYTAEAARVRDRIPLRGPDIYDSPNPVDRDVYTLRAKVLSGNSGGPLVDADGAVLGVIFGAAVDDSETGFALTAAEVREEVARRRG
ncbi:MarP family serine protease [Actinokineospora soli]|uniref:MarP family serine protease n=1 Tax=Actinokineospora soli TaxID=1048753 RepID=A0ABW2TXN7_9PSEU